ncbi:o-succinylbenzoate synthase [Sporosarcina luteola]|nr:o-succinylbenzoate synthase [Sporosarcina luteola]
MSYLITDIRTYVVQVPLASTWQTSLYKSNATRGHAIVEVTTEGGVKGYGEASPSAAFMGETADTIKFMNDTYLAPLLRGKDIRNIGTIHQLMDSSIYGMYSAKATIDIAVHDALAKTLDQPLYAIIGGLLNEKIPLTYVIGMTSDDRIFKEVEEAVEFSYEVIKIKVGSDWEKEAAIINKVCAFIQRKGLHTRVRLDANQGFTVDDAIRFAGRLTHKGLIDAFEQPVQKRNVSGLLEVKRYSGLPIMADESVFNLADAADVFERKAVHLLNIKLGKVGGIYPAKKIAAAAEAHGIPCTVGSNLELGIGIAANMHFVASTKNAVVPHDLFAGHMLHKRDIVDDSLKRHLQDGYLSVPDGAGLGVRLNEDWKN